MSAIDRLLGAAEEVRAQWCEAASEEVQAMIDQRLAEGWSMRMVLCATGGPLISLELLSPNGTLSMPLDKYVVPSVANGMVN
jgi:hypothetical protein